MHTEENEHEHGSAHLWDSEHGSCSIIYYLLVKFTEPQEQYLINKEVDLKQKEKGRTNKLRHLITSKYSFGLVYPIF